MAILLWCGLSQGNIKLRVGSQIYCFVARFGWNYFVSEVLLNPAPRFNTGWEMLFYAVLQIHSGPAWTNLKVTKKKVNVYNFWKIKFKIISTIMQRCTRKGVNKSVTIFLQHTRLFTYAQMRTLQLAKYTELLTHYNQYL
jgi:hypothetical protein